jgi:nucleotide-binding universal stress UspA family protein
MAGDRRRVNSRHSAEGMQPNHELTGFIFTRPALPSAVSLRQVKALQANGAHKGASNRRNTMYSSILVPVDLAETELAARAIEAAVTFAKTSGGRIRLVYVRPFVPMPYMEYVPANFDAGQKAEMEADLAKVAASVPYDKDKVSMAVLDGSIHSAVLDEAKSWGADLIIVWSHRPGFATYLIGSNAATMVRHSTCSVLVVR